MVFPVNADTPGVKRRKSILVTEARAPFASLLVVHLSVSMPVSTCSAGSVRCKALDLIDQDQSGDLGHDEVETLLAAMGTALGTSSG